MSGELLLESRKGALPALALSCLLTLGIALVCLRFLHLPESGVLRGAAGAFLAYVLFRVLYPAMNELLSGGPDARGTWRVTEDTLYLNEEAIPRSSIRQVYCWPNRNALGQTQAGWTVNIELDRGHRVLRSRSKGGEAEYARRQLRAMVVALGCGSRWAQSEETEEDEKED